MTVLEIADLTGDGHLDDAVFEGARSDLLVHENLWAAPFGGALRRSGAQPVAPGRLKVQAVLASLEAAEAASRGERRDQGCPRPYAMSRCRRMQVMVQ